MCPWDSLTPSPLAFCEAPLCAWIKTPADTWSNVAYLFVGVYIIVRARRDGRQFLTALGIVSLVTGAGSGFYHASGARIAMLADYAGMFLGTAALTAINVRRAWRWSATSSVLVLVGVATISVALVAAFPHHERTMYIVMMPCCFLELFLFVRRRERPRPTYRSYLMSWGLLLGGMAAWWLDLTRRWCSPDNHVITGHAVWHVTTAVALVFLYAHYRQFAPFDLRRRPERAGVARPRNDCRTTSAHRPLSEVPCRHGRCTRST